MSEFDDTLLPGGNNNSGEGNTPENGEGNSGNNNGNDNSGNNSGGNSGDDSIGGEPIEPELDGGYVGFSTDTPTEKA